MWIPFSDDRGGRAVVLGGVVGFEVGVGQDAVQPLGDPPVEVAHQLHRRGDKHEPDERGVERDRDRQPDADLLDLRHAGGGEDREDDDHDQGGAGDHLGAALQALGDGAAVVPGGRVALLDATEQEHLVVHAQPEDDRQQQRRRDDVDVAERVVAGPVEPAVLEEHDHHAVGGADRQQVHQHGLQRQDHAAQDDQQHHVAADHDEQEDLPDVSGDEGVEVVLLGRVAADVDDAQLVGARLAAAFGAQAVDQRVRGRRLGILVGDDLDQRRPAVVGDDRALDAGDAVDALELLRVGVELRSAAGDRPVRVDDDQQRGRLTRRDLLAGEVEAHAGFVAVRELAQGAVAELQRQRRDRERDQDAARDHGREYGPAHDAARPALPEGRRAGRLRALRPHAPVEPDDPADDLAPALDAAPGERDQRGQQRHRADDRERDDGDRADRQRVNCGRVEQEQAGQRDDHRDAGEDDRGAGGPHRGVQGG